MISARFSRSSVPVRKSADSMALAASLILLTLASERPLIWASLRFEVCISPLAVWIPASFSFPMSPEGGTGGAVAQMSSSFVAGRRTRRSRSWACLRRCRA